MSICKAFAQPLANCTAFLFSLGSQSPRLVAAAYGEPNWAVKLLCPLLRTCTCGLLFSHIAVNTDVGGTLVDKSFPRKISFVELSYNEILERIFLPLLPEYLKFLEALKLLIKFHS